MKIWAALLGAFAVVSAVAGEVPRIAVDADEAGAFPALDWGKSTEVRRGVSCLRLAITRPRLMKAELLRCDLSLFDFAATRRSPDWGREFKDAKTGKKTFVERTQRMSTRDWIESNDDIAVAVNASPWDGGVGQGRLGKMPADPNGFCMSYGEVLSDNPCWTNVFFVVRRDGTPDIICTGKKAPSAADRRGYLHVFMGYGLFLQRGVVLGARDDLHPRTSYGLSRDRRHLYLLVVDGRQPDWSLGANNFDLAQLMIAAGAHDGINMDGGGSSAILYRDPGTKRPVQLNRHDVAGAYARPVAINLGLVER